ncbi:hypothetical protein TIFTF001_017897 [Ficus carica]|uniref:Uncharacterized protein n=1 Tax=Ficus carica TaxID=3494 RepID=A0AA88DJ44_FICCA|nr:hypothetical protein TIFTF001_017897 [Ficus carica]
MLLGGALSFNLLFPSTEPDIWRLMGMWSIWMFTIPSLRARDCSKNEKEALNYLFLVIPLLNIIIPFFLKSFAVVWSADIVAFFGISVGYKEKTRNPRQARNFPTNWPELSNEALLALLHNKKIHPFFLEDEGLHSNPKELYVKIKEKKNHY